MLFLWVGTLASGYLKWTNQAPEALEAYRDPLGLGEAGRGPSPSGFKGAGRSNLALNERQETQSSMAAALSPEPCGGGSIYDSPAASAGPTDAGGGTPGIGNIYDGHW